MWNLFFRSIVVAQCRLGCLSASSLTRDSNAKLLCLEDSVCGSCWTDCFLTRSPPPTTEEGVEGPPETGGQDETDEGTEVVMTYDPTITDTSVRVNRWKFWFLIPRQDRHMFLFKISRPRLFNRFLGRFFVDIMNSAKRVLVSFQIFLICINMNLYPSIALKEDFILRQNLFLVEYKQFTRKLELCQAIKPVFFSFLPNDVYYLISKKLIS